MVLRRLARRFKPGQIIVPMDIIVVTPDEVARRRNLPGTIIRPAL